MLQGKGDDSLGVGLEDERVRPDQQAADPHAGHIGESPIEIIGAREFVVLKLKTEGLGGLLQLVLSLRRERKGAAPKHRRREPSPVL
jgi:hypothetical protein